MNSIDEILEASHFDDTADQACAAVAEMVKAILVGHDISADPTAMPARMQTALAANMREMMHKGISDATSERDRHDILSFIHSSAGQKWLAIGPALHDTGKKVGEDAFNAIVVPWLEKHFPKT